MTKSDELKIDRIREALSRYVGYDRYVCRSKEENRKFADKILEICDKPRKLSEEKYKKELLRRGIKFTANKFQRHWESAKSILESDVWQDND